MPVNKRYFIDLMKDRRLSLREVARRMDVWPAALSRSIDGKRKMQMPEAVSLARILSVPLTEVMVNAGIEQAVVTKRRCSIIGHVSDDYTIHPLPDGVIERVPIPDGLGDDVVAVQMHTAGTAEEFTDGWVTYLGQEMDPSDCMGLYAMVAIEGNGQMLGVFRRGYTQGTFNLISRAGVRHNNVKILWARRAYLTTH